MATLNEMIAEGTKFYVPDPVAQYNKLAQMQQYQSQNALSQQEAIDKATERQRLVSERTRRATFLSGFSAKLAEKGFTLDRRTLSSMMSSGIPDIEKLAFEGLKALSAEEAFNNAEGGGAPAAATPMAAPAPALTPAPAAMVAPTALTVAPTVQASIDDMVNRGVPIEAITVEDGKIYVGSYGPNVVGETQAQEEYRTPEGSLALRPQAPLTPLRVAANQMAPSPANAMAPQAALAPTPTPTVAPAGELERLIAQRNRYSKISPQTPGDVAKLKNILDGIDKQIEVLNRQEEPAVRIAHAIAATFAKRGTPEYQTAFNKALGEQTDKSKDKVNIIGVAKGTGNPVYLDSISDEQYIYVADADGKQKRKLYSGPVDRSTSNVSQNVSNKVDAFIPASEAAQTQFMQESRQTFNALKNAQPTLDNIEAAKALVPTAKGFMGTGGEPLLLAASFLNNRLGMKIDTKGVTDASELRSRLFFGILDNLKKLDSQPSQAQQAIMQEALGNLGTDPNALGRVLDAFGDSIRTKVDLHNAEVSDAETRGVKFPYSARIVLKPKSGGASNPGATATHPSDIQAIIDAQKRK